MRTSPAQVVIRAWFVTAALLPAAVLNGGCGVTTTERAPSREAPRVAASSTPATPSATPPIEAPPESGRAPEVLFPRIVDETLENGLELRTVQRTALPLVELSLTVLSGSETDGERVGVSRLSASLLKDGGAGTWTSRQLVERAESLGATLEVSSTHDRTVLSLAVTTQHVSEAMDILAALALRPRLDAREFAKLKEREIERVTNSAKTNGAWAAAMVLYRELYQLPTDRHPYSGYDATPTDVERVRLEDCRRWLRAHFVPKNALLVAAGDISPNLLIVEAKRAFGSWRGERPEPIAFPTPLPPRALQIYLVDRPDSTQSDVFVGLLGPERRSENWPALDVANQVLGGGVAGRLFLDVREQRSLAYSTGSRMRELAHGPVLIILSAGTRTEQAPRALEALLDHVDRIGHESVSSSELSAATRFLADSMLINTETVDALAALSGSLVVLGLPASYYDDYRAAVRGVSAEAVLDSARRHFTRTKALAVVAGSAQLLAAPLSRIAPVVVLDPENRFVVKSRHPHRPAIAPGSELSDSTGTTD